MTGRWVVLTPSACLGTSFFETGNDNIPWEKGWEIAKFVTDAQKISIPNLQVSQFSVKKCDFHIFHVPSKKFDFSRVSLKTEMLRQ